MMVLFMMFPCTTFKHTITAIALITLQDYIQCKYIKKDDCKPTSKRSFLLQIKRNNDVVSQFTCKGKFIHNLSFI